MPTSRDPDKRARQLANLRQGGTVGPGRPIVHGAYARLPAERIDAKVRQVAEALAQDAPVRASDGGLPAADAVAVRQLAEALCRLDDIAGYLNRRGWEDDAGKVRSVAEYEGRLRGHVLDLLRELGMTPKARAALGLNLARTARTLEDEIATGGEVVRARFRALDGEDDGDAA